MNSERMPSDLYLLIFTDIVSTEGFLIGIALVLIALLARRHIRSALVLSVATAGLLISTVVLKEWLRIPRPDSALIETTGYALPSGHATGSLFLFFVLAYLARHTKYRAPVFVLCTLATLAIGWSRIDLGVHTPLQVLAGYALGAAWAFAFVLLEKRRK